MDFKEVKDYLDSVDLTMERYEIDSFKAFLQRISFSYHVPSIEIAGSNGKGETLSYLASIYRAAGYRVATFEKPLPGGPCSWIKINGEPISERRFAEIFSENKKEIEKFDLTSFEATVYVALTYFEEEKPDLAIIEAGMGGEGDATNVYDPILSVITSVSLEHTEFLGRSISEIAYVKSGIMRPLVPVLVGTLPEEAETVIIDRSRELNSPFHRVDQFHAYRADLFKCTFDYLPYKGLTLKSPSRFGAADASLAIEAVNILEAKYPVDENAIRKGLENGGLPCRMEVHGTTIIDGAHNPEAATMLVESLQSLRLDRPYHVLFACYRDKNIAAILPILARDAETLTLTTFDHPRARNELDYFLYEADYRYEDDYRKAYEGLREAFPEDYVVVTGSLDFAYRFKEEFYK